MPTEDKTRRAKNRLSRHSKEYVRGSQKNHEYGLKSCTMLMQDFTFF